MAVCVNCYQDHFLREKVTKIETAESAQQVLDKVDIWVKIMDKYEDKYNIEILHPNYDAEIRDYEDKLNELNTRLTRAKRINKFVEYSEIMDDGYKLLIELFESITMKHFKDQVTLNYVNFKTNDNSFKIDDLLQIKLGDNTVNKLKEDLTKELQDKFNRDTEAERERLREEFEAKYSQTIKDLKAKADEFEAKNNELGVILDEKKAENNDLKEQIDEHKFEKIKKKKANLKTKLDSNISKVKDLEKKLDESKEEVNDFHKANSDLKKSKREVKKLNDQVEELKEEKKEKKGIIDKMEEEKKSMQAEIENFEKRCSDLNEYVVS